MKINMNERPPGEILWPELIRGTLLKRYKRFLADIELASGEIVTAHCANSGKMTACSDPGMPVYVSYHDNPKRKLKYSWQLIEMPDSLVGVNTMVPNKLVQRSIESELIEELTGYDKVQPEVTVSAGSRLDLMLTAENRRTCYVEVKNSTLVENSTAFFPDAVTTRGLKHLVELQSLITKGFRCAMFFLVQRMDAQAFKPADHVDPAYGKELRKAAENGVEILVYDTDITLTGIQIRNRLPWVF